MNQDLFILILKTRKRDYNCYNFANDVWQVLGKGHIKDERTKLDKPENPCIVYLSNSEKQDSHVGIFIDGKVLHLGLRVPEYIDVDIFTKAFRNVSFYK